MMQETLLNMEPTYSHLTQIISIRWESGAGITLVTPPGKGRYDWPADSYYAPADDSSPVYSLLAREWDDDTSPIYWMAYRENALPFYLSVYYVPVGVLERKPKSV